MKNIIYILPFLLLPLFGLAQENSDEESIKKESVSFNNQIDFDLQLLGGELTLKKRIKGKFFLGVGAGTGLFISLGTRGLMASWYKFKGFLDYDIDNRVHVYVGYQFVPGVFILERDNGGPFYGGVIGLFDKGKKIEYGVEVSLGGISEGESLFTASTTLLVLKIPMVRW